MSQDIVSSEVRFALHLPINSKREHDVHLVKEQVTYSDGRREPRLTLIKDFKRPVWVTRQNKRNHKEKKEFEHKDNLHCVKTTQSDLNRTVANLLNKPTLSNSPDGIKNSPYVYGYDQTSTSFLKLSSLKRNNFIQSPYSVATFDIETNITTGEVIIASVAFKEALYVTFSKNLIKGMTGVKEKLEEAFKRLLSNLSHLKVKFIPCDTEVDVIRKIFNVIHQLKPDFLAIWNMDFDIPTIINRLKYNHIDPANVLCDPQIPQDYRYCRYKQGIKKKVTASGKVKPINPSLQWHTLFLTASFYVIDAMCVYRQLRMAEPEQPNYKLNTILQRELNTQKLSFTEADSYKEGNWHDFMQKNYPIEYIIYNLYDTYSMMELEDKTNDLKSSLPSFAGITDFNRFNSNPKKIVDALFLFALEKGYVIGTVGSSKKEEDDIEVDLTDDEDPEDFEVLSLKGWIQTLPQSNLLREGLNCIEEYPSLVTNIRGMVVDLDSVSSYPTCTTVANVSKETCVKELISIDGVREDVFRQQNLGVVIGNANVLEYVERMFDMPSLNELDSAVKEFFGF